MKTVGLVGAIVSAVGVVWSVTFLVLAVTLGWASWPIWIFNVLIWSFNTWSFTRTYNRIRNSDW